MDNCGFIITDRIGQSGVPLASDLLIAATVKTNDYLDKLPGLFDSSMEAFYAVLNQRNLSGFVGEVFKHAVHALCAEFVPNPHPDGRPDILDLRKVEARAYYTDACFSGDDKVPRRDALAPFAFGGIEVKATIGNTPNGGNCKIGQTRSEIITGLNFWAHHVHACDLMAIYYDFCQIARGAPQIKAIFFCKLEEEDWKKVSIGRPDRKKTSNTSLNSKGVSKIRSSIIMHSSAPDYCRTFERLGLFDNC
jgi:hypothetical protein